MANQMAKAPTNQSRMKALVASENVKSRLENLLGNQSGVFLASVLDLYNSDTNLQKCDPNAVMAECMKAAALRLPISKALGFAYIIPYGTTPTFQLGYRGLIQLAQRSGQYRHINADVVYEGEEIGYDRITGMLEISGEAQSEEIIGYFAYFQLMNGFEKAVYWSKDRVISHAKRFSQAFKSGKKDSPWFTSFDAMALKTVLKSIISKYGPMSVEFADAMSRDTEDRVEAEVAENANGQPIVINTQFEPEPEKKPGPLKDPEPQAEIDDEDEEPGF